MNNLNSVLVDGNLVRDPQVVETSRGTIVCNFALAMNRFFKQNDELQKEVSFIDVEAWSGLGSECGKRLHKGNNARVIGRLKQDRWNDETGRQRSRIKIVAEHVDFKPPANREENAAGVEAVEVRHNTVAADLAGKSVI